MMRARSKMLVAVFLTIPLWSCMAPKQNEQKTAPLMPVASNALSLQTIKGVATLCPSGTRVLYSCQLQDKQIASMCLSPGLLTYIESYPNRKQAVQETVASLPDWSNIRLGHVIGGGGGYETHVRFTNANGVHYIVLEGAPGQYHDVSGGPWSGVTIVSASGQENSRRCEAESVIEPDWSDLINKSAPAGIKILMEEEGSKFDGWY